MHGDRAVSTKNLARLLGVKTIAPCAPAVADRHSGYQVGGTSPFGIAARDAGLHGALDRRLPRIYVNGGRRGYLVGMRPGRPRPGAPAAAGRRRGRPARLTGRDAPPPGCAACVSRNAAARWRRRAPSRRAAPRAWRRAPSPRRAANSAEHEVGDRLGEALQQLVRMLARRSACSRFDDRRVVERVGEVVRCGTPRRTAARARGRAAASAAAAAPSRRCRCASRRAGRG